uniref:Rap-GAP domain-containing protein n=1 Tax=Plectus sambesii TaxID=2011161 RepID=A0A914WTJ9_9BILA
MRRFTYSSPSDMKQRHKLRGSVRRDQYGTVELVVSIDQGGKIKNIGRFRVEPGPDVDYGHDTSANHPQSPVIVENPQMETRWYWKYYLGNEHQNFAGIDPHTKSPFFMSILIEDEADGNKMCRAILWTSSGPRRLCIANPHPSKVLTAKGILQRFPGMSDFNRGLKEIVNAKAQRDLVLLEDQEGCVNCKFGVIYALDNQISDAEMLSNEHGNEDFDRFLKLLGQRIELHGWGSYRGGLDTTTNSTGRESVYTAFANHEIMFHVSTLLPYSKENRQQIERKRHVGNDIVNLVFEAGGDPAHPNFSPTMMKSHFTHVFASTFLYQQGLTLNDEPVAVSVFEKGTPHGTVKAVLATKHHLIIADFGNHTHRVVYSLNDIPKGTLTSISGAVDGDVDEIVFAYDNITVLIELHDDGTSTMQETFWTSNVNSVVCRFPFVVGFGHDIIEVRLAINGNLLSSMYKPGAKLLAAKDDIIFAAEKMTLPVPAASAEKSERPVLRPSITRRQHGDSAHKRWDLYRISAKNLQTNGVEQRERQDWGAGGLTPQLLRNPQTMAARLRREAGRDGSTASDSGFSSRGYPSGAEGSIDASMPNSPMYFSSDPFAEPDS